jgi:putative flippase GtrA
MDIEDRNMPYKSVCNILAVWFTNGVAWLIALSPTEWLGGIQIIKELIAIVSLLIAIGFTLYKWKQSWSGWIPKRKK